jgi:hypothetical protein
MPSPEQVIRTLVGVPLGLARRVARLGRELLPGRGDREAPPPPRAPVPDAHAAAARALRRERDRSEEPPPPDADLAGHVESEVELVAESADIEATEPPGPQLSVEEPWEGYRRMRVAEIAARLEDQSPEVLAAVELYETTHRNRRGVLAAVRAATRG